MTLTLTMIIIGTLTVLASLFLPTHQSETIRTRKKRRPPSRDSLALELERALKRRRR